MFWRVLILSSYAMRLYRPEALGSPLRWLVLCTLGLLLATCGETDGIKTTQPRAVPTEEPEDIIVARLGDGDDDRWHALRRAFANNNPGYQINYLPATKSVMAASNHRILFVQDGGGTGQLSSGPTSKLSVGDIISVGAQISLETDSLIEYVSFAVPVPPSDRIPVFIRPDWDPNITDTPGGCATETNAYRRILLTWLGKVGPYLYKHLNAHRVRIMDSFTHYHPKEGGFDEFYLVQMALPEARLITSTHTALIEDVDKIEAADVDGLLKETPLNVGDLVYIPRGVVHRGIGGVLAQVITIPGFVPEAEIGVDYHLRRINEKLGLSGKDALPFHHDASHEVVIK